jgi:hypothetical protein
LTKNWVAHDVRDQVVDFVRCWSEKTEISVGRFPQWLGIGASKFYDWRKRCGRVNEHNGWIPRDFWLEPWEKEAIISLRQTDFSLCRMNRGLHLKHCFCLQRRVGRVC